MVKQSTFSLTKEIQEHLTLISKETGLTKSDIVRRAIEQYIIEWKKNVTRMNNEK